MQHTPHELVPTAVLAFAVLLAAIAIGAASAPRAVLALLFLLVGLVGGAFFSFGGAAVPLHAPGLYSTFVVPMPPTRQLQAVG